MNKEKLIEWINSQIERDKLGMEYNKKINCENTHGNSILFGAVNILERLILEINSGELDVD